MALAQKTVMPRVSTAQRCVEVPTLVHCIRWAPPKELQTESRYHGWCTCRVGKERGAGNGFQLIEISKTQKIDASKWSGRTVSALCVPASLLRHFCGQHFDLPKQLCGDHADFICNHIAKTLASGRKLVDVSRAFRTLRISDGDPSPMVNCEAVDQSRHCVLKSKTHNWTPCVHWSCSVKSLRKQPINLLFPAPETPWII